GSHASDSLTSRFTSMLFGGRLPAITDAIGNASGIRGGTAASLLTVGVPMLLGTLRKRVRDGGMDASRLTSFLTNEADEVRGTLPAGIENAIESETGTGSPAASVASRVVSERSVPPVATGVVRERSNAWIWPLILGLIALGWLLWWLGA